MHKKLIGLIALFILLFAIGTIAAQEPTEPAPEATEAPVIEVLPTDGGTVVNVNPPVEAAPAPEPAKENTLQDYLNTILAVAAFVASAMVFLTTRQRDTIISGAETVEHYAWLGVATFSEIVQLIGGRADTEASKDPHVLARALRNKEMNVIIAKTVDIDAVIKAYQEESL